MGICYTTKQKTIEISNKGKKANFDNYLSLISKNTIYLINKSLCKICIQSNKDESYGIGFFMNICLDRNFICLITNYKNISKNLIDSKETFVIQLDNQAIRAIILDNKRRFIKYLDQPYNIIIIEILNSDLIINNIQVLDYDLDCLYNYKDFLNKKILILNYSSNRYDYLNGQINNIKDFGFEYTINTDNIYPGSPILLLENQKVIGIYDNNYNDKKFGIFIGEIIKELKKEEGKKINVIKENEEEEESKEEKSKKKEKEEKEEKILKKIISNDNSQSNNTQKNLENIISIKYLIDNEKNIKIFGTNFIENNKNIWKIIINNEEKELCEYIDIQNIINSENLNILELKLKQIKPVQNISYMFSGCKQLFSITGLSNLNTSNIKSLNNFFFGCSSLSFIPDISNWDTSNVIDMGDLFSGCSLITSLPEISKWNTCKVQNMSYMFSGCQLINYIPDISILDTSKVTNFSYMFHWCKSLSILPDISKWDTGNIIDMSWMFSDCSSLEKLPSINNWKTSNVTDMNHMFFGCSSLLALPDISFWITNKVKDMSFMFYGCSKLESFPDIKKWNRDNLENTKFMFQGCKNPKKIKFNLVN